MPSEKQKLHELLREQRSQFDKLLVPPVPKKPTETLALSPSPKAEVVPFTRRQHKATVQQQMSEERPLLSLLQSAIQVAELYEEVNTAPTLEEREAFGRLNNLMVQLASVDEIKSSTLRGKSAPVTADTGCQIAKIFHDSWGELMERRTAGNETKPHVLLTQHMCAILRMHINIKSARLWILQEGGHHMVHFAEDAPIVEEVKRHFYIRECIAKGEAIFAENKYFCPLRWKEQIRTVVELQGYDYEPLDVNQVEGNNVFLQIERSITLFLHEYELRLQSCQSKLNESFIEAMKSPGQFREQSGIFDLVKRTAAACVPCEATKVIELKPGVSAPYPYRAFCRHISETGQLEIVNEVKKDKNYFFELEKTSTLESVIGVPFVVDNLPVALLVMENRVPHIIGKTVIKRGFCNKDVHHLTTLFKMATSELQSFYRGDIIRQAKHRYDSIISVIRDVLHSDIRNLDDVANALIAGAKQLTHADRGLVWMVSRETDELVTQVEGSEVRIPTSEGLSGVCFSTAKPLNVKDVKKDHRLFSVLHAYDVHSLLIGPLYSSGEIIGVCVLYNKKGSNGQCMDFTEDDEETCQTISLFASTALHNAGLVKFAVDAAREAFELQVSRNPTPYQFHPREQQSEVSDEDVAAVKHVELPSWVTNTYVTRSFDIFRFRDILDEPYHSAVQLVFKLMMHTGLPRQFHCPPSTLLRFVLACRKKYRNVPYHNFYHAVDVVQTLCAWRELGCLDQLEPLGQFALLVTGLTHDLDHMGLNNSFHFKTDSPLGILSNSSGNKSVLEVHHCRLAIAILEDSTCDVFCGLGDKERKEAFQYLIDGILATDMARHKDYLTSMPIMDFSSQSGKKYILEMLMKAADISNVAKPFEVSSQWAQAVTEEFLQQGDVEKAKGVPVLPMFDRAQNNELANGQLFFITNIAKPFFVLFQERISSFSLCVEELDRNIDEWKKVLSARNE